jgi:hypothetical protein
MCVPRLVSHWSSNEELLDTLLASCYIPMCVRRLTRVSFHTFHRSIGCPEAQKQSEVGRLVHKALVGEWKGEGGGGSTIGYSR